MTEHLDMIEDETILLLSYSRIKIIKLHILL